MDRGKESLILYPNPFFIFRLCRKIKNEFPNPSNKIPTRKKRKRKMSSIMFFSGNHQTFRAIRPLDFEFANMISDMKQQGFTVVSHQFGEVHLKEDDIFTHFHKTSGNIENIVDI